MLPSPPSIYDLTATTIDGKEVSLSHYRGSVALVVNTASQCAFTSQYKALETLYQNYKERSFVVLGFPSNDFLGQEPTDNHNIQTFCQLRYGVSFPLFAKAPVKGAQKQPVYRVLTEESDSALRGDVSWNFIKFLVDRSGSPCARFGSFTKPTSKKIISKIEQLLRA